MIILFKVEIHIIYLYLSNKHIFHLQSVANSKTIQKDLGYFIFKTNVSKLGY